MLLLFTCSPKKWIVGALECVVVPHLVFIVHFVFSLKRFPSHSTFIVYHLYYYGDEDGIFIFFFCIILPWSMHYPNRLQPKQEGGARILRDKKEC